MKNPFSVLSLSPSCIIPSVPSGNNIITSTTMSLIRLKHLLCYIWFAPLLKLLWWYNNYQNKVIIIIFRNQVTQISSLFTPKLENILFLNWNLYWSTKKEVVFITEIIIAQENWSFTLSVDSTWIHLTNQKGPENKRQSTTLDHFFHQVQVTLHIKFPVERQL